MATVTGQRIRARPAHPAGSTVLTYTPDGQKLITAGTNSVVRVYSTGSDSEPVNIDDCTENNFAIAATNSFFLLGSEDGSVSLYSLQSFTFEKLLTRSTLPIRDIVISPDEKWVAVASDEIPVKLINLDDFLWTRYLRDHPKPIKHLSYDPSSSYINASCTDGVIYTYHLNSSEPQLRFQTNNLIKAIDTDSHLSSEAIWHPDGRAFAVPTSLRYIQVIDLEKGEPQVAFKNGHVGDITALAWSPNGALLLTAGTDNVVLLWDTKSQEMLARYEYTEVINLAWHTHDNIVSFVTSEGELFIHENFLQPDKAQKLEIVLQKSPFLNDSENHLPSGQGARPINGHQRQPLEKRGLRQGTPDSLDSILGPVDVDDAGLDFVSDDDGAGYTNGNKRSNDHFDKFDGLESKRPRHQQGAWRPQLRRAFQPGSTPWRGNRRYLCVNLIGFIWTIDQSTHHTVTVEFNDREFHRDLHFTDPYRYDMACLTEQGALFACPPTDTKGAMIFYRPHETWTARTEWRTYLPEGDQITTMALSAAFIVATTVQGYVRIYTQTGTPYRIYCQKSTPAVTCAAWKDYVLYMGNGPVGSNGIQSLVYTIENVRRDETCQSDDTVALPAQADLASVFFSDIGDPCIYDSNGLLSVLQHWRIPGQAKWVPILDTRQLERLASGRKEESYWPVAVAEEKFHCIILKGGDDCPSFPKPLLSEFELRIPIGSTDASLTASAKESSSSPAMLEEAFVRQSLLYSLHSDLITASHAGGTHAQRTEIARRAIDIDKTLLQLINFECREGEEHGMKALDLVQLLRDPNGKTIEAAAKVASRYNQSVLADKIVYVGEQRLLSEDVEDEP